VPRSEESKARRREYAKRWAAEHPGYHAEWRAAHRESENERIRRWRQANPERVREQRKRWRERRNAQKREVECIPTLFNGHDLFDRARAAVGPRPKFNEHIWEEAVAEAVLAILEDRDPREAARKAYQRERTWRAQHPPIYDNADITADGRLVIVRPQD
jgi:hypothetical protein